MSYRGKVFGDSLPFQFSIPSATEMQDGVMTKEQVQLLDSIAGGGGYVPEPANTVFAGPESGPDVLPQFRALVVDDLPAGYPAIDLDGVVEPDNGGFGLDASALTDGVIVKSGGVFQSTTVPSMSGINIDANTIPASSIVPGTVDNTEFGYLNGATSNIQDQLDALRVDVALTSLGGLTLYLQEIASDIVGYETLRTQPSSLPEDFDEVSVSSGTSPVYIDSYVTDPGIPGINQWPAGNWIFHVHSTVDNNAGTTQIIAQVYSRTTGGTEALLFSATSAAIVTGTTEYQWNSIQPEFPVNQTDRLVIKFYATTTSVSHRTVRLYYQGATRTSFVLAPIPTPIAVSGAANQVLATPSGADGAVNLRKIASDDFSDGTLAASKLLGGTLNYFLASNGSYGIWVNTPVGWTISGASNTFTNIPAGSALTGTVPVANGGTNKSSWTVGSIPVASGSTTIAEIAPGTAGHVLTSNGAGVAPSMQAPIAGTVVSGTFSGTYDVPATTFANVGLSLVLAAGQWRVTFDVRNLVNTSAGNGFVRLRLYDTTANAVITDSETQGFLSATTGAAYGGTTSITKDITLTVTSTINLQAARGEVATYNAAQVIGDSDGWTRGTAFRRA